MIRVLQLLVQALSKFILLLGLLEYLTILFLLETVGDAAAVILFGVEAAHVTRRLAAPLPHLVREENDIAVLCGLGEVSNVSWHVEVNALVDILGLLKDILFLIG